MALSLSGGLIDGSDDKRLYIEARPRHPFAIAGMSPPKVIYQSDHPYFVKARCQRPRWFELPMDLVWDIMCRHLNFIWHVNDARIHSFVLLESEWRLLVKTPRRNIDEVLHHFMRETSRELTRCAGRINQAYGRQNQQSVIERHQYFRHAYKLIHREPVEAGLAGRVEEYKYSSLPGLLGLAWQPFPVVEDKILFANIHNTLEWLNQQPTPNNLHTIKVACQRPKFWLPKQDKKLHKLEYNDI